MRNTRNGYRCFSHVKNKGGHIFPVLAFKVECPDKRCYEESDDTGHNR